MKERYQIVTLIVVVALLLLPFFLLAFYAVPMADDYYFSGQARQLSLSDYMGHFYNRYTGRMFPVLLFYFNPLSFDFSKASFIVPLLALALTLVSVYSMVPVFTGKIKSKAVHWAISLSAFAILMQRWPSTAEGFYWMSGALFYTIPVCLFLVWLRLLHDLTSTDGPRTWKSVSAMLLAFILPLCNEVILFPSFAVLALICMNRDSRIALRKSLPWITGLFVSGIAVLLLAPGNYARMNDFSVEYSFTEAAFISLSHVGKLIGYQFQSPVMLLTLLGIAAFLGKRPLNSRLLSWLEKTPLAVIVLLSLLLLWAMYLPSQFLTNYVPWRVHNTATIILFIIVLMITVKVSHRFRFSPLPKWSIKAIIVISVFLAITDLQWRGRSEPIHFRGNIPLAWSDLVTRADQYSLKWVQRTEEARNSAGKSIVFEGFEDVPQSIHFTGLKKDPDNDLNRWYAAYYHLESVKVDSTSAE